MVVLYISSPGEVIRSTYSTSDGEVLYKAETPRSATYRTTSILRLLPPDIPSSNTKASDSKYGLIASIDWKTGTKPPVIRYGGQEFEADDFLRMDGTRGADGSRPRVLIAPDGKEYMWRNEEYEAQLITYDEKREVVAQFHRQQFGIFHKKCPARLEVTPEGEEILDIVLVTFIFIEKIRLGSTMGIITAAGAV
ncbi:hypothetical protein CYLTODRAFT_358225 [Cylindrobasidium torrendii FP15055 ss-10]|uniref:DUF6593 domain-containing protein n=1 Tax=Cylindrobasidium torrendii FP15055 ss-10 TaxID=1314674 RepID=A0A0D7B2Y1_9AGAR|nr:hypothetical protein CYLTODRAFT_358225 [Cylindrobasidium torrendii FP15055 ss-10]